MYESIAMFICQLVCICTGFIKYITSQNNFCSVSLGAVYLDQRSCSRHNNGCLNTRQLCCIGNALCMVSCRSSDQALCFFFFSQSADLVISTSYLVSAGILHVLRLEIYLISGLCGKIFAVDQLCLQSDLFYDLRGLFKFL